MEYIELVKWRGDLIIAEIEGCSYNRWRPGICGRLQPYNC